MKFLKYEISALTFIKFDNFAYKPYKACFSGGSGNHNILIYFLANSKRTSINNKISSYNERQTFFKTFKL